MPHVNRNSRPGFTWIEIIVVVALIAILIGFLVPAISSARQSQRAVGCLANLQHIAAAFDAYAADNDGILPNPASTLTAWEVLVHQYVNSATVFRCPSDSELYPSVGSSYDWRDTGDPTGTAAGKRLGGLRPDAVLVFDALPGWHHPMKMNAAFINGSARELDRDSCLRDVANPAAP